MEGISDAQRYRYLSMQTEAVKKDDRDIKINEIDSEDDRKDKEDQQGKEQEQEAEPVAREPVKIIEDTDEEINTAEFHEFKTLAGLFRKYQHSDIDMESIEKELQSKGFDCYLTEFENKTAIRFSNGDIFIDTKVKQTLSYEEVDFVNIIDTLIENSGTSFVEIIETLNYLRNASRKDEKRDELTEEYFQLLKKLLLAVDVSSVESAQPAETSEMERICFVASDLFNTALFLAQQRNNQHAEE